MPVRRIGYREWARRNGKLYDIRSLDDRNDHDVDALPVGELTSLCSDR